jgi:alkanesulfonate monooxygenase SsuD/methylene tetrahydromethanopterin reductase-like flavin-dependent oxidoreductase (luciferase family)
MADGTGTGATVTSAMAPGSGRAAPLRFGWRVPMWDPDGAPAPAWLPEVRANLDALHGVYDSIWLSDHFVPGASWMPPEPDTLECWTAVAHFATAYPEYHSYRHPALLGKMASTLQLLTGGRLILGIGAGWMESEYRMYGYPFPPAPVRLEQLDEACHILRRMWTTSPASFQGKHYALEGAYANPLPSPPPPLLIGSHGERIGLGIVARHADWWDYSGADPDEFARKATVLAEHCERVGRDPDSILFTWQCQVVALADSEREARALAERSTLYKNGSPGSALVGTPEGVAERLARYVELGVRHPILRFADFPSPEGALRFAREVMPTLRGLARG